MDTISEKKAYKKEEIIRKSIHVMLEYGYNATGVQDLANAAGIPKGSLYNYFENKEDYLKEALVYYYEKAIKTQFDILRNPTLEPLERIKQFFQSMIDALIQHKSYQKGCFLGNIAQELCGSNVVIQEVVNDIQNDIIENIRINLSEAINKKELSSRTDTRVLSEFIYLSWQGALLRAKASRNKETLKNFYSVLAEILLSRSGYSF